MKTQLGKQNDQLVTVDEMRKPGGLLAECLSPIPSKRSIIRMLNRHGIKGLKQNPAARRGGGTPYFHVAAVEKMLRSQAGK